MNILNNLLLSVLFLSLISCSTSIEADLDLNASNDAPATIEVPEGTPTLLFVDIKEKTLNRVNLTTMEVSELFSVPNGPSGVLAFDPVNQHIYYHDYDNERILRNTLAGDDEQVIIEDAFDIRAMSIDPEGRNLYFSTYTSAVVRSYNLDDASIHTELNNVGFGSFGNLQDMEYVNGKLYSITPVESKESVFRTTLSTKSVSRILGYEQAGYGYGIGVDAINGHIYFNNVERASIMRSSLDGEKVEDVINLDKVRVYGIVADGMEGKLYWTTWGNQLGIADLDGSNKQIWSIDGASRNLIKMYWPD